MLNIFTSMCKHEIQKKMKNVTPIIVDNEAICTIVNACILLDITF